VGSFLDWADAVRFRLKLVGFVTALVTLIAVIYLLAAPRVYLATSSLVVDARADPLKQSGGGDDQAANTRATIATQADLIRSPSVTGLAATNAGLDHDPVLIAAWRNSGSATPYADWLRKRLTDGPVPPAHRPGEELRRLAGDPHDLGQGLGYRGAEDAERFRQGERDRQRRRR